MTCAAVGTTVMAGTVTMIGVAVVAGTVTMIGTAVMAGIAAVAGNQVLDGNSPSTIFNNDIHELFPRQKRAFDCKGSFFHSD
ncbi:hypothetical protein [Brevibacillus dissolubilis]|uniref:hypothetical protein n=1 Tax=Brevibacillus dissolubilis TaxID=1844116 RepID=UPI00159BEC84|nr:hypothetical protein [Brevibacillus dissolubilis]